MTRACPSAPRPRRIARVALVAGVPAVLALPVPALAQLHAPDTPRSPSTAAEQLYVPETPRIVFESGVLVAQGNEKTPAGPAEPLKLKKSAEPVWGENKSYLIPALEIIGFDTLLNRFDHAYFGCCDFDVSRPSIRRNLRSSWNEDRDTFTVNQIGHPYQGSMYHGFARASGLSFWEGLAYTFAGSAMWEIFGETTPPSKNDQISTGIGGVFLGEPLFRMANLWLEQGHGSRFWREVGAAAISPPVGFNRLAFGNRFKGIYPSNKPEYYSRLAVGVSAATQDRPGTSTEVKRKEAIVDFAIDYGLPGKTGYAYRRPFDYFAFQAIGSSAIGVEAITTRGLLVGTDYGAKTKTIRGIWGLYGSYDYIAPQIFRLASTAVSLGTTLEWRPTQAVAVQATALAGVGYASVSTIHGIANERDNSYGVAPQAAVVLRTIFGDRVSLDLTAREYFVSDVSGSPRGGHDNVIRADTALTWRVSGPHALAVKYQFSRRDSDLTGLGDRTQQRGTIGIFYTLLGRDRFGTGDWR